MNQISIRDLTPHVTQFKKRLTLITNFSTKVGNQSLHVIGLAFKGWLKPKTLTQTPWPLHYEVEPSKAGIVLGWMGDLPST